MRRDLPTGTVTFLFTDIEGSTRLLHALGPDAYAEALAEHRRVLRASLAARNGVEVDTQGDAFFIAFPTAEGAATAALEAQQGLASGPITVRMGLHTGTPTLTPEGYVGVDVHRGARVAALAHGGQVVLSPATAALLDGHELRDLGLHRLKDFDTAIRLSQLDSAEFPPLRTRGSVELPVPATRFIGREGELFDAISVVYDHDPRVLSILGAGGTGKTRFAIELGRLLADEAEGGTVFCAFAPIREPAFVLSTIGERLGAPSGDVSAIASRVGEKRTHVVVDNIEHLLPDAARRLGELAQAIPAMRLFVTSREALRVTGEHELDLPPLVDDDAVALFLERAHAVGADIEATETVQRICERLDRLPLALELAAVRTKLLSPDALYARLGESLDLLKGTRDADERHATLRATIAWSYDLLSDDEQALFRRLSVFRGGCTLESAEAVCDADLDTLASLLDKSLVRKRTGALEEEQFWMLETIKEFARERLAESGDHELGRRHADRMLDIIESAHLSEDDDEPFQLEIALAERDDLRAALDWAADHDLELAAMLAVELETFWNAHAQAEGRERLNRIVQSADALDPGLRARALRVAGNVSFNVDRDLTQSQWEGSLELFRSLGNDRGAAMVLHRLALFPLERGDLDGTRRMIDESQALAAGSSPLVDAVNQWMYAALAFEAGDIEDAIRLSERSAAQASAIGWAWWVSGQRAFIARLALGAGDLERAEREARAALLLAREHENPIRSAGAVASIAQVALARRELERAGLLWGWAEAELTGIMADDDLELYEPLLTELDAVFASAVERGRHLDLWDAATLALGELEPPQTEP
ncbi:MAG TPA: adenylate/guanylate cyclase domain-containing protein [Gaiellaceae bacterium]